MKKSDIAKVNRLLKRAEKIQKDLEEVKSLYNERDDIIDGLIKLKFKANKKFVLIDNFKKKNFAFKTACFNRFTLELIE